MFKHPPKLMLCFGAPPRVLDNFSECKKSNVNNSIIVIYFKPIGAVQEGKIKPEPGKPTSEGKKQ